MLLAEDVLLELLRPCEPILTTFVVTPRLMDFCRWAHRQPDAGVLPALRRCAALTELEAPASWLVAGHLNHFPGLTTLHLTDLGTQNHAEVRRAMAAFPVARNIKCLSVTLAFQVASPPASREYYYSAKRTVYSTHKSSECTFGYTLRGVHSISSR